MAAIPYMPLYVADYLGDAGHLTTAQHGAYLLLLMNYWQRGKGLPANDAALMSITRMSKAEWEKTRPAVLEFFIEVDGVLVNNRSEKELARFRDKSTQSARAANARWESVRNASDGNADAMRTHIPTQCHTDTDTRKNQKHTSAAPKSGAVEEWFEFQFWPIWTKAANDSKGAALKSARAKVRDAETQALVIEGARRQRLARLAQEPKYRSHAATWLNQSRWIDGDEQAEEAQKIYRPLPPPKFWVDDLLDPK